MCMSWLLLILINDGVIYRYKLGDFGYFEDQNNLKNIYIYIYIYIYIIN